MSRVTYLSNVCDNIGGQGILVLGELISLEVLICLHLKVTLRGQTHKHLNTKTEKMDIATYRLNLPTI